VVHTDSAELRGAQGIPSSTAVALAGVTMNAAATVSGAQAQVVDFGGVAFGSVSFTGATLDSSTAFDFDTSALKVSAVGGADASGLAVNDVITVSPTDMMYGLGSSGTRSAPIMTMWTDGIGTFEETFTDVESVDRGSANAITIDLAGNDHRSRLLGCVGLLDVVRQPDWRPGSHYKRFVHQHDDDGRVGDPPASAGDSGAVDLGNDASGLRGPWLRRPERQDVNAAEVAA
jgi:hypothetical protein